MTHLQDQFRPQATTAVLGMNVDLLEVYRVALNQRSVRERYREVVGQHHPQMSRAPSHFQHSYEYDAHRFGHVILQYRGRVVSLLVTANGRTAADAESAAAIPHVIGRPLDGLSVVSVNGSRHAVMLVGDLEKNELTQLAGIVSLPLVERLANVAQDRTKTLAWLLAEPAQQLEWNFHRRPDSTSLLSERLPQR